MCQVVIVGYKKEFYYPLKIVFFYEKKCFLKNWLLLISITTGGSNIIISYHALYLFVYIGIIYYKCYYPIV